jgi:hypothetical protein
MFVVIAFLLFHERTGGATVCWTFRAVGFFVRGASSEPAATGLKRAFEGVEGGAAVRGSSDVFFCTANLLCFVTVA